MTGLQRVTNLPIAYVRNGLELIVVFMGWSIGGTAGIATLMFALLIGPTAALSMQFLKTTLSRF